MTYYFLAAPVLSILLLLLVNIGVMGAALSWLTSYLADIQFYISMQDYKSPTASLKLGVPQGSVLGPVLLILYI